MLVRSSYDQLLHFSKRGDVPEDCASQTALVAVRQPREECHKFGSDETKALT
jgi:hypothetical protein